MGESDEKVCTKKSRCQVAAARRRYAGEPNARRRSMGEFEHQDGGNIARSGGEPKVHATPVHSGMHSRNPDGSLLVGVTQTSVKNAPDASGARPNDPTVQGKRLTTPQTVVNHRSRTAGKEVGPLPVGAAHALGRGVNHDLGRVILDEAFANSGGDTRKAHGRE